DITVMIQHLMLRQCLTKGTLDARDSTTADHQAKDVVGDRPQGHADPGRRKRQGAGGCHAGWHPWSAASLPRGLRRVLLRTRRPVGCNGSRGMDLVGTGRVYRGAA